MTFRRSGPLLSCRTTSRMGFSFPSVWLSNDSFSRPSSGISLILPPGGPPDRLIECVVHLCRILLLALLLATPAASQEKTGTFRMTVFELKLHGLAIALETPSGAVYFVDTGKETGD